MTFVENKLVEIKSLRSQIYDYVFENIKDFCDFSIGDEVSELTKIGLPKFTFKITKIIIDESYFERRNIIRVMLFMRDVECENHTELRYYEDVKNLYSRTSS
jgi:hypothetical protein